MTMFKEQLAAFSKAHWPAVLAAMTAAIAAWVAVRYAAQPLLEWEAFRQTQTALTSYWMIREGWQIPYQTPVLGYPWEIPYEFPIYQTIVAAIARLGGLHLDPVGRLVSFAFLLACAWPAFSTARRLELPPETAWIFSALLWSSPLYLFYGRAFLVETAAVFFTLAAIPYALDLRDSSPSWRSAFLFSAFASLAMLQKLFTAFPMLVVMLLVLLVSHLRTSRFAIPSWRRMAVVTTAFAIPFAFGGLWTRYADLIRGRNPYGALTTVATQSTYYLGTLADRFDLVLLKTIFWDRVVTRNAGGLVGAAVVIGALLLGDRRSKAILLVCLLLFALPVLLFIRVHHYLDYYQVSSAVFLAAAVAVATIVWSARTGGRRIAALLVLVMIGWNLFAFSRGYGRHVRKELSVGRTRALAVGDVIRRYTPPESGVVVFGLLVHEGPSHPVTTWSSEIAYYSERKALTVEDGFEPHVWHDPASFLGGKELGAIVVCAREDRARYNEVISRYSVRGEPRVYDVGECQVWLPEARSIVLEGGRTVIPRALMAPHP
ncbi:MAG TPA: hypothetical protein VMT00_15500 [Thermoanaerobaculia bacterium]|nr:hypothetical protein [Thermoanaerobaculia bacterium]